MDIDWASGAAPESDWRDGIRIRDDVVVFRLFGGGIEFDPGLGKGPMEISESWSMEGGQAPARRESATLVLAVSKLSAVYNLSPGSWRGGRSSCW